MISFEDIQIYLPKYLTPESKNELFDGLKQFPNNIDTRFYTNALKGDNIIYQGDGIKDLLFVNLPDTTVGKRHGMVLSNSCDISLENRKFYSANIIYAPIVKLNSFVNLLAESKIEREKIGHYVNSIKKQYITQIFYLPQGGFLEEEFIVFLDKINSCGDEYIERKKIEDLRLFSLSNYGLYVFIVKLSIHLMRFQEGIDRKANIGNIQ